MLGSVLAIENRSPRSEAPSAVTSRALRMYPDAREKTVPAAMTAEEARIRCSVMRAPRRSASARSAAASSARRCLIWPGRR